MSEIERTDTLQPYLARFGRRIRLRDGWRMMQRALWIACAVLTLSFPYLNAAFGAHGVFWIYALICLLGYLYIFKNLPETKGKSLEQIERELVD